MEQHQPSPDHDQTSTAPDPVSVVEERLKDAAYTAIGAGIFAYKYSEPKVKRFLESVEKWKREQKPDVRETLVRFANTGRAQASRSRQ